MPKIESIDELQRRRDELRGELAAIGDFRPGTLVEYKRKCGKPNCHCAQRDDPGHPGWALMRKSGGKHVNRGIPKDALERTRAQIAEHRRFRELSRQLVEASEALCRARLAAGRDAGRNAQKRGFADR